MIISGKNSVYEALESNITVNKVVILSTQHDEFSKKIIDLCHSKHIRFDFARREVMDKMASHHQGYIADVTEYEYSSLDDILEGKENHFILILDNIQDPHNLGSIIRVCDCAGVDGIIIPSRHSTLVNETVYKTSGGAVSHVKIAKVGNINEVIKSLKEQNIWVYCAEAGGKSVYGENFSGSVALVMGSEGEGVSRLTKELCDEQISLPMFGKVNSLNVSTATSAILYEMVRQREIKK
jgi:23S rRNA (guanosine2251-2'-O)-methyltransferase